MGDRHSPVTEVRASVDRPATEETAMERRTVRTAVACALLVGLAMLPAPALAWTAFAKMTTATGVIEGDVTDKGFEKQIRVLGLGNDLKVALDPVTGFPLKLQLGRLLIVKTFDIATPRMVAAMSSNTVLTKVEITLFKTTATGASVPGFKILLTNARITELETTYNPGAEPAAVERVEMSYEKFSWTDLITGATGSTP
jgi:type VI secretion system Hcp family effector